MLRKDYFWHGEDETGCGWMAWLTFLIQNGWRNNNERKRLVVEFEFECGRGYRWIAGHNNLPVVWIYMRRCGCGR